MRRSPWLNKARMDWCVQRQFDYNTLVLRAGNYMRDQTGLAMLVRSAGDFCCDRLASRRYGVRVSTRPSQGRNPGSNPGIATKACQSTEMAREMAPVKIARKLFLSEANDESYRPLYVVLAQAQKASHEVIALQSNGGSLIDLDIDASTRSHGKSEGRRRNAQVALARVNGAQLDVSERR